MRNIYRHRLFIKVCCIVLFLCLFQIKADAQKSSKLIEVLIVDGFSNHDWKQTTKLVKAILEESKRFKVDVSTAPPAANDSSWASWNPVFKNYDAVIQNSNNISNKDWRWPRRVEEQLENYVRAGGGLYVLHSGNNSFPHWKEYDLMMGMGWRPKETGYALEVDSNKNIIRHPPGEGNNTSHGKKFDAIITILNNHPINKGFPAQWKTPSMELYTYARGPAENTTILSYAYDSTLTHKMWPVEWVMKYGKGRYITRAWVIYGRMTSTPKATGVLVFKRHLFVQLSGRPLVK